MQPNVLQPQASEVYQPAPDLVFRAAACRQLAGCAHLQVYLTSMQVSMHMAHIFGDLQA